MPKILIIDDEGGVRITLKKIMERKGYEVDTAADYEEAIGLLGKSSYDTVVTDIFLPGLSGIDLLKAIRKSDPDLPVIVITGDPNVDTASESVRQAAYDYIAKPVTKENLPPIIARSVEKKQLIDEKKRLEKENLEYQKDLEKRVRQRTKRIEALNERLKESQSKLMLSERLATLGTFVSFVSHDLRNPLSVIRNSIYYLNSRIGSDDQKVEKHFRIINEELEIANKIIDDLLSFSKGRPLDLQPTDINALITKVLDLIIIPDNVDTVFDINEDIPDINVDGDQIMQVLINMINNAVQAMPQGGRLTLQIKRDADFIVIDISDTGMGMSPDDLDRIFDPFYSSKQKGTGLGLVICEFLVERHAGTIMVKSEEGKGSTFSIKLPMKTRG